VETPHRPTVARIANAASAQRLDGLSILVVDDDRDACDTLKILLGSLGASVATTTSAQAALATLKTLHPDAIISDIEMPAQDGYFLARELRKWEQQTRRDGRVSFGCADRLRAS
jgi:CheY-like chemotaxis protein